MTARDLRPETPTRALLRRVQRRSSAAAGGGVNVIPPVPNRKKSTSKLRLEVPAADQQSDACNTGSVEMASSESEDRESSLLGEIDQLYQNVKIKDARIEELEELLREATLLEGPSCATQSGGLTRAAALKLEREFASQEFILQGLQKDNEAKTIEVERLRRDKKTMSDYLARQLGSDDWEAIVFGVNSSFYSNRKESERHATAKAMIRNESFSTPLRSFKGPMARFVQSSDGIDSSFFSADESVMDHPLTSLASSPVKGASMIQSKLAATEIAAATTASEATASSGGIDLAAMLTLIEAQKMLIKGFERSNALKMIECQETIKRAREGEQLWNKRLEQHMQKSIDVAPIV